MVRNSIDRQGNIWTYSPSQGVHVLLENTSYWPILMALEQIIALYYRMRSEILILTKN